MRVPVPDKLWLLVDSQGKLIHHTHDESNLGFMQSYVLQSKAAGHEWAILRYRLESVATSKTIQGGKHGSDGTARSSGT